VEGNEFSQAESELRITSFISIVPPRVTQEVIHAFASKERARGFTLIVIGMLANYFPARRAGRIEPVTALRNE
jgi:ABC-type lipoprotein release transport system permease subunit